MEDIKILYEDKHITVCVKPPLILSQGDEKGSPDMTAALETLLGVPHKAVHRLDYGVGGTMVYAKTDKAAASLSRAIQEKKFEKEYLAVVYGVPAEESGIYKDLLFKDSKKNKSYVVDRVRRGVKDASLEYRLIDSATTDKDVLSLVYVKLHTGRTHQIRVQFASRKTPLYGDGKYGSKTNEKVTALWSHRLAFPHPISEKIISFTSIPEDVFPWNLLNFEKNDQ